MQTGNRRLLFAWKLLIFLLLTNYQTVVILCKDFILLKFLRDVVLVYILAETFARRPGLTKHYLLPLLLLIPWLVWGVLQTKGLGTAIVTLRKYLFPLGVLAAARNMTQFKKKEFEELTGYLFTLTAILSLWGIFQAHVLKDQFLIEMGYPTIYANAYKRITLRHSYYFGNLGIQRVTSTVSNSNVFGIITGVTLITVILQHKRFLRGALGWIKLGCIAVAYILTVSRSNFLAMVLVAVVVFWKYIPYKKQLAAVAVAGILAFIGLYAVQESDGLSHKLVNWVVQSLTGQESSASGRSNIWLTAINKIVRNPLGIGFGKTGTTAIQGAEMYACENSYLAMALDMGIPGALSFVGLEGFVLYDLYRSRKYARDGYLMKIGVSVMVYFMAVCLFSNHIYDMEAISLVFVLVAASANLLEYAPQVLPEGKEGSL